MNLTDILTVSTGALVIRKVGNRDKEKSMTWQISVQFDADQADVGGTTWP